MNRYSYCRNNPVNYIDPTGYSWWSSFWKSLVGGCAGGIVTGVIIVLSGGVLTPLALMAGGAVAGAVTGALTGGVQGALMGAGMGLAMGGGVALWGAPFAIGALVVGAGIAGVTGGWEGLGNFAVGLVGGIIGGAIGYGIGTGATNAILGPPKNQPTQTATTNPKQAEAKAQTSLESDQKPTVTPNKVNYKIKPNCEVEVPGNDGPYVNQKIYRVFGDATKWDGKSWTPVNPESVPNYRIQAGLPDANSGRFVAEARITQIDNIIVREAIVIYGNGDSEMITEYVILDPKNQINIDRISGVNPEY